MTGPLSGHRHFGPWQSLQIPVKRERTMDLDKDPHNFLFLTLVVFPYVDMRSGRKIQGCIDYLDNCVREGST